MKNGALFHSKAENGKDFTPLCQLSAFDVFFVAQHTLEALKAPKPCVFALKSLLPRAHYEDSADYCYYVSVKTDADLQSWVKIITEARVSVLSSPPSFLQTSLTDESFLFLFLLYLERFCQAKRTTSD